MAPVAASAVEVPVFTETSLGTRVALSAPLDITAVGLKGTLEREYFVGFPESGPVRVHGLMVRRRSCFYHLPDSMPVKYVFNGAAKAWFLHADLRPSDDLTEPCLHNCIAMKDHLHSTWGSFKSSDNREGEVWVKNLEPHPLEHQRNAIHAKDKKGKKNSWLETCHLNRNEENESNARITAVNLYEPDKSGNPDPVDETTSGNSSAISVGEIIKRYFCSQEVAGSVTSPVSKSDAVQSQAKERTCASGEFAVKTPARPLNTVRDKSERRRIGKRLVTASYILGVSPTRKTLQSLRKSQNGELSRCSRGIKCSVFEISDSSDNQSNS